MRTQNHEWTNWINSRYAVEKKADKMMIFGLSIWFAVCAVVYLVINNIVFK